MTSIDKNILVGKYQRADENNRLLSAYRPLPPETLKSLREYYRVGLTYTSNAIEGNSLTESETKVVIEDGLTIEGKPLRDIYEAVGHAKAYDFLHEITEKKQLEEEDILTLHRIFYQQIDPEKAGVYRSVKVFISGSRYAVSPVARIAEDMRKLVNWYNRNEKKLHPIELAAELHLRFVFIHPFIDGNGRVSRLLMNLALLRNGFTIAIIPAILRHEYIRSLEAAHTDKSIFFDFISDRVIATQSDLIRLLKSQDDTGSANNPIAVNKIRQGIWTEYDTALSASGKYTEEELEEMPAVGMMVEGDKAYFFTYSAEGADNLVEGKISYNKDAGWRYRLPCHQGQPCFRPDRQLQDGLRRVDGV